MTKGNLVPDEDVRPEGALWWTFRSQTPVGHALVVLGGLAVWMGTYALHLSVVGGSVELVAAGGPDAVAARRAGMRVASAACWLWFAIAFTVGKGGPMLDVSLYPAGALVFGPYLTALVAVGRLPPELFTTASPTSAAFVVHGLGVFVPGFTLALAFVGTFLFVIVYVTGTHEEWAERHMPEAWFRMEVRDDG